MNFFEHQDQARRNTTQLIVLFFLEIAAMIAAFYLAALLIFQGFLTAQLRWWQPDMLLLVSVAILGVIGFGSLTKMAELRRGGAAVAEGLGGRKIDPQTNDVQEMTLLNVVAEMALASGTPIPTVYLLPHEPGINAFAAGYSPDDAVIGVTQGCVEQLSRDELQGVIAHEFSHILNGDMRLNLTLIGVLQGLLFIHILGRVFLRSGMGDGSHRSRSKEGGGFFVIGLALAVIGGIGLVFGRLIKSAVSRQREFLADASAVQFTRNPDGIAGALRRIGGFTAGSRMQTPRAEEASHLFFGEAISITFMDGWFATHPPLKERIRRIAGVIVQAPDPGPAAAGSALAPNVMGFQGGGPVTPSSVQRHSPHASTRNSAGEFLGSVGTTSAQQLATTHAFLQGLPEEFKTAVRSPAGAMAIIYGLLMDQTSEVRSRQLALLESPNELADPAQVERFADELRSMDPRQYLSLVDLAIPALRTLTAQQCAAFFQQIKALVRADGRLSVSEYVLQLILQKRLRPHFQKTIEKPKTITTLTPVWNDCQVVLTVLSRLGHKSSNDALYALKSGLSRLPGAHRREMPQTPPSVKLYDLGTSLKRLESTAPKLKQAIVDAAAHTVLVDNDVTPLEAELLRAIVITLDCPIPPFLEVVPQKKLKAKPVRR